MGFIRGGLVVIAGVFLFLLFLAGNLFLTLNYSLEYENIKPELSSVIKNIAENEMNLTQEITDKFDFMLLYCENNSEFVFGKEEFVFVIPCETINLGPEAVIDNGINDLIEDTYYKDYNCKFFIECSKQSTYPFFLISEKAKDYWKEKFYFVLTIALVLIGAMLILLEDRLNLPIIVGSLLIVSSLPFVKLESALSLFSIPFLQFITIFFSKSYDVFLMSLITGIIFLVIGIILKFFKMGFKINSFFSWLKERKNKKDLSKDEKEMISKEEVKDIVKKEISKDKPKEVIKKEVSKEKMKNKLPK